MFNRLIQKYNLRRFRKATAAAIATTPVDTRTDYERARNVERIFGTPTYRFN